MTTKNEFDAHTALEARAMRLGGWQVGRIALQPMARAPHMPAKPVSPFKRVLLALLAR
jgi:hypothetical protein